MARVLPGPGAEVVEQGRVVAEGTYDSLVENNAAFRRLVSSGRG